MTHTNPEAEVARLLKLYGAVLERTNRHLVYKFPDGKMFTCSSTASDVHAVNQRLRDLRRILGLNGDRGAPGERKQHRPRPGRPEQHKITPSLNPVMEEAFRKAGVIESGYKDKIAALTLELQSTRRANTRRRIQLSKLQGHNRKCWWCRFTTWLYRRYRIDFR